MVFNNSILLGAAGQGGVAPFDTTLIGNSIWLEGAGTSGDAATKVWGAESNQDRWIWATWFQPLRLADATATRSVIFASGASSNGFYLRHNSTASTFNIFHRDNAGSEGAINTTESYRDLTAWIHVLVDYDSANANAENRISLYINGVRTGVNSGNRPGQNNHLNTNVNGQTARIGQDVSTTPNYHMKGYLAQTIFLDNKSIANSDLAITDFLDTFTFGTNGSQIVPKADADIIALASAAGANSFCLNYSDASSAANLVSDASSKGNNFSTSTIATANQSVNTPSNLYPIINIIDHSNTTLPTISEGNLRSAGPGAGRACLRTTIPIPTTGKWYWEAKWNSVASARIGFAESNSQLLDNCGQSALSWGIQNDGTLVNNNSSGSVLFSWSTNDIIAMAYDADASKFWFGRIPSGSTSVTWASSGNPETGANATVTSVPTQITPALDTNTGDVSLFFPEEDWTLSSKLSDFKEINSANLTAPDFQGIDYFDSTIYEGNGTGQRVGDFVPFTDVGTISQSVAFNLADSDKLTIASSVSTTPTNVQKKTISVWLKPWKVGENFIMVGVNGSDSERIYTTSTGQLQYLTRGSGSTTAHVSTNGAFVADPSQWVHVVFGIDYTDGSTEADRVKIYVNGVQITDLANTSYPANNMTSEAFINKASTEQIIGKHPSTSGGDATNFSDMYYAEYYMVDGLQLTPSTFGQLDTSTNRWVAKSTSTVTSAISSAGGFGNCGFYLNFSNTSDYGEDSSGNNRDFTESGVLDATNQFTDAPSLNFPIIDIGTLKVSTGTLPLAKGGLQVGPKAGGGGGAYRTGTGFSIPEGSWIYKTTMPGKDANLIGVWTESGIAALDGGGSTKQTGFYGINMFNGELSHNKTETSASDAASIHGYTWASDISSTQAMNVLINRTGSTYKLWFVKDGATAAVGNPAAGTGAHIEFSSTEAVYAGIMVTAASHSLTFDFGASNNGSFTGNSNFSNYKLINQDNLDDTASKLTAWAWIKNRDADDDHVIVDRARGVGKVWESNTNTAAFTNDNTVQRFLQRGVQIGNDVTVNTSGESYVLWQWLVGDSATTGSTTSPAGTIPSTTIVSDASHFSVGTYTGDGDDNETIGHGLGGIPEMIIVRNLSRTTFGLAWHTNGGGANHTVDFAQAQVFSANSAKFGGSNGDNPTANVFTIGTHNEINANGESFVFYALRSVPGVCKVGSYTPNNVEDGPYISLGFTPAMIFLKCINTTNPWMIFDNTRDVDNPVVRYLQPNSTSAEKGVSSGTGRDIDFLSDGFKIREDDSDINGGTSNPYLFVAMADIGGNGTLPPIYGR